MKNKFDFDKNLSEETQLKLYRFMNFQNVIKGSVKQRKERKNARKSLILRTMQNIREKFPKRPEEAEEKAAYDQFAEEWKAMHEKMNHPLEKMDGNSE